MSRNRFFGWLASAACALLASFAAAPSARAQDSNLQYQVANLVQDIRLLDERIRQVSMQLEDVRRENAQLRQKIADNEANAGDLTAKFATVGQLNQSIQQAVAQLQKRDEALKGEIVLEVTSRIEDFARKVERIVGSVPQVAKPDPTVRATFNLQGVPSSGTPYVVAPGDTLDSIARKFDSRVDWIQNANKISDPRLLQVGQTLFIPQSKDS